MQDFHSFCAKITSMKKLLILMLTLIFNCVSAEALEIIYPKHSPVTINANSTFFIGSTNPTDTLTINGKSVEVHKNGAFSAVVPLHVGENNFKIISTPQIAPIIRDEALSSDIIENNQPQTIDYVITKPVQTQAVNTQTTTLIEYPNAIQVKIKKENAPLRTVPIDAGITRLSHLPVGMQLLVNGEKNNFYRVILGTQTFGWIMKADVEQVSDTNDLPPALVSDIKRFSDKEFNYYEFYLNRKSPYAVKEENGLKLRLYNVEMGESIGNANMCDNVLTYIFPYQKKLYGYDTYFDGENLIVKVRKTPLISFQQPLRGVKVFVDAGHGGAESGSVGPLGGAEKDINLAIAKNLKQYLVQKGAIVTMTREDDSAVSLSDRVKSAKSSDSIIFVSVHANALPDGGDPSKSTGTATYYYYNEAKPLATAILNSIVSQMGLKNNNANPASFAVVRNTACISVLVETAYMINPEDYALLTNPVSQMQFAKAIADGIEHYISGESINLR